MRAGLLGSDGEKSGSPSAQMNDQSNSENLAKGAGVGSPRLGTRCIKCGCPLTADMQEYCKDCPCGCYPYCVYPKEVSL